MASGEDLPNVLDANEAAAYLRLSPRSIRDRAWRLRVGLRAVKIGGAVRFLRSELDTFMRRNRERPVREVAAEPAGETTA